MPRKAGRRVLISASVQMCISVGYRVRGHKASASQETDEMAALLKRNVDACKMNTSSGVKGSSLQMMLSTIRLFTATPNAASSRQGDVHDLSKL